MPAVHLFFFVPLPGMCYSIQCVHYIQRLTSICLRSVCLDLKKNNVYHPIQSLCTTHSKHLYGWYSHHKMIIWWFGPNHHWRYKLHCTFCTKPKLTDTILDICWECSEYYHSPEDRVCIPLPTSTRSCVPGTCLGTQSVESRACSRCSWNICPLA